MKENKRKKTAPNNYGALQCSIEFFFLLFLMLSLIPFWYFFKIIDNNLFFSVSYLFEDAKNYVGLTFDSLQTIFVTLFTAFVGVYFTILGIFLADKKVSFIDFYKFTSNKVFLCGLISFCFQFLDVVLIFSLFTYTVLTEILLYLFILYIFIFSTYAVIQMTVIQNYKKCLDKFVSYSYRTYQELCSFYENFICKCFPNKLYKIFDDFFVSVSKKENNDINVQNLCLNFLTNIDSENHNEFEANLKFITRRIIDCTQRQDFKKYDSFTIKLIETYFSKYKNFILTGKCKYSYILEIRDSIFFHLLDDPSNEYLKKYYKQIIASSYNIICISFYHLKENSINQEISDFIYLTQFFNQHNELSKLEDYYSQKFVDVLVRLANCIKIGNRNLNVMKKFVHQLDYIKELKIFDCDFELYEEEQIHKDVYTPIDTRNYYIGILFCYYYACFGKEKVESIVNKLIYYKNQKFCYWHYYAILKAFDDSKITNEDFCSYYSISKRNIDYIKTVKKMLEDRINNIKGEKITDLKNKDVSEELNKEIEKEIAEIKKQFKKFRYKSNQGQKSIAKIETNLCISKKILTDDDKNILFFGTGYDFIAEPFLYSYIMRQGHLDVIPIHQLNEIENLDKEKNELILPMEYRQYIYSSKIKNIEYLAPLKIKVNDIKIKFHFVNCNYGLIMKKEDFENCICLQDVETLSEKDWQQQGEDFIKNINICLNFAVDMETKITCYRLEF